MDDLTEAQYESTLQYMQQYNEQDFQTAVSILQVHDFDLKAYKEYRKGLQRYQEQREGEDNLHGDQYGEYLMDEDEIEQLNRMKNFLLNPNRRKNKRKRYTDCIKNLCFNITEKILPEVIKAKILRSPFYQIYQQQAVVELKHRNIRQALKVGKQLRKNLLMIVSENGKNHCLVEFLKKKKLLQKIVNRFITQSQQFEIVGVIQSELHHRKDTKINQTKSLSEVSTNANSEAIQYSIFERTHAPSVIALRQRHTQQLQVMEVFYGQEQILGIKQETLTKLRQKAKAHVNKQASLLKRIIDKFEQNYYRINEGDSRFEVQANRAETISMQNKIRSQQNKEYTAMESKINKQKELHNQKYQQIEQLLQQRNCRKLSLPDEPFEGEQCSKIIKVMFRCPNGENITRKFGKEQKCQILFAWVDLNDDIQFEIDESEQNRIAKEIENRKSSQEKVIVKERKFDLMYSYPPQSLRCKMDMSIGDIFEDEQQIKILIKEE